MQRSRLISWLDEIKLHLFSLRDHSLIMGRGPATMRGQKLFDPIPAQIKRFCTRFVNLPQAWEWSICKKEKHPNPCWNLAFQDKDQNFIFWQFLVKNENCLLKEEDSHACFLQLNTYNSNKKRIFLLCEHLFFVGGQICLDP